MALDFVPKSKENLSSSLGNKRMMFLRNHGTLTQGRSIAEAFILMHNLERSCEIQIAAQSGGRELALPPDDLFRKDGTDRARGGRPAFCRRRIRCGFAPARSDRSFLSRLRQSEIAPPDRRRPVGFFSLRRSVTRHYAAQSSGFGRVQSGTYNHTQPGGTNHGFHCH